MYIRSYTNIYKKNWDIHILFILEKIHKSSPDPLSVAVRPWTKGAFRMAGYGLICRNRLPTTFSFQWQMASEVRIL